MIKIIFSQYFFILLFFIFFYLIITLLFNEKKIKVDKNNILIILENYRIKNIYYVIFQIIIYFFLNSLIFVLLRLLYLKEKDTLFYLHSFSYYHIINLLYFMITIILYFKILEILFYPLVMKTHIYMSKNKKYKEMGDKIIGNTAIITTLFTNFCDMFAQYAISEKTMIYILKRKMENKNKNIYNTKKYKRWKFINNYKFLYYFCYLFYLIDTYFNNLSNLSRLVYSLPSYLCIYSLIYDLYHGRFYYFYLSLLLLLITNILKKIRKFYENRFIFYESLIAEYLYFKNSILLEEELFFTDKNKLGDYIIDLDELMVYINNGFIRNFIIDINREIEINIKRSKRLLAIFSILLLSLFFYNTNKYTLQIFNFQYNTSILVSYSMILIIILYLIHRKIKFYNKDIDGGDENNYYKWIFRLIIIIFCFPLLFIILKNKIVLFPTETIIEIKNILKITEIYDYQDKINYLEKILNYLEETKEINSEEKAVLLLENTKSKMALLPIDEISEIIKKWKNKN